MTCLSRFEISTPLHKTHIQPVHIPLDVLQFESFSWFRSFVSSSTDICLPLLDTTKHYVRFWETWNWSYIVQGRFTLKRVFSEWKISFEFAVNLPKLNPNLKTKYCKTAGCTWGSGNTHTILAIYCTDIELRELHKDRFATKMEKNAMI